MKLFEISKVPTVMNQTHESVLRSYHTLQKVKDYLRLEVPHKVTLDIVDELESIRDV